MYVKKIPEDDTTYSLLADKLRSKGVNVTTGTEAPPADIDALRPLHKMVDIFFGILRDFFVHGQERLSHF